MDFTAKPNPNVLYVMEDTLIKDVVAAMNNNKVGSLLILDASENVTGIITERDIVRKFTLLDVADKLHRKVRTIMTPNVHFAKLETLYEDIVRMHFELGVRHFPVLKGNEPTKANVAGVMSVTDVLRFFLELNAKSAVAKADTSEASMIPMGVIAKQQDTMSKIKEHCQKIGIACVPIKDIHEFVRSHGTSTVPIFLDLDGFSATELRPLLQILSVYRGPRVMAATDANIVASFRRFTTKPDRHQIVVTKPVDFSYIHWLLSMKWKQKA